MCFVKDHTPVFQESFHTLVGHNAEFCALVTKVWETCMHQDNKPYGPKS